MTLRFPIGTKFLRHSRKDPRVETVVDVYTTTNIKGDVVKVRDVCTQEFSGQETCDYDVPETTIARSELI